MNADKLTHFATDIAQPVGLALLLTWAAWSIGYLIVRSWSGQATSEPTDSVGALAATGLSFMLTISLVGVIAPVGAQVAGSALGVLAVAGSGLAIRRRDWAWQHFLTGATVAAAGIAVACIPFLANGRFGVLGVGVNNDLAAHLTWTQQLASGASVFETTGGYLYPLGPHALSASLQASIGMDRVEPAFSGFMMAVQAISTLLAWSLLRGIPSGLRFLAAPVAATAYMVSAYYAQGAFKEPTGAMLIAGMVACTLATTGGSRWLAVGVLQAGMFTTLGVSGLAWTVLPVLVVTALSRNSLTRARDHWRSTGLRSRMVALVGTALTIAVLSPVALGQLDVLRELGSVGGGNIPSDVHPFALLGIWFSYDFRILPGDAIRAGALGGAALLFAAFGALTWRRTYGSLLPVAVGVALALYAASRAVYPPYFATKSMVLPTILISVLVIHGAVTISRFLPERWNRISTAFVGGAVLLLLGASTMLPLAGSSIGSLAKTEELAPIRTIVGRQHVVFLGHDPFINLKLGQAKTSTFLAYSLRNPIPLAAEPRRIPAAGTVVDFEAIDEASLDNFQYALTTSTAFASTPPDNWKMVKETAHYRLFKRKGQTTRRSPLGAPHEYGARVDCDMLPKKDPVVLVRQEPRVWPGNEWKRADGSPALAAGTTGLVPALERVRRTIQLGPGTWQLAIQYSGATALRVTIAGDLNVLPAEPDTLSERWPIGDVSINDRSETLDIELQPEAASFAFVPRTTLVGELVAVRTDDTQRVARADESCGKFADWVMPDSTPPPT